MTAAPTKEAVQIDAESRDEIDQILNEVEALRKELSGEMSEPVVVTPAAKVATAADDLVGDRDADLGDDVKEEVSVEEDLMKELRAITGDGQGEDDAGLEDTLAELPEVQPENPAPTLFEADDAEAETETVEAAPHLSVVPTIQSAKETVSMKSDDQSSSQPPGTLSIHLQGNMTLKLKYEYEGQEVTVGFADQFLKIELADGTEFKIPVGKRPAGTNTKHKVA